MSMEHQAIPIGTFEAITLQDSIFLAFHKQLRNFSFRRSWRHQLRISLIVLSTLFIVAFPTLVSAMTGYAPVTETYVTGADGQLILLTSYRSVRYIVHDADRVELKSPLVLADISEDTAIRGKWPYHSAVSHTLLNPTDIESDPPGVIEAAQTEFARWTRIYRSKTKKGSLCRGTTLVLMIDAQ